MDKEILWTAEMARTWLYIMRLQDGLTEAISDLNFIRTATNDAQIAALAEAASAVATCYLKQAKGEQ
jgi:hypothetical protein